MVPLGEVVELSQSTVDPSTVDALTPYIGLEHIERGGRLLAHPTVGEAGPTSPKARFQAGDLLFGKLRPNLAKVVLLPYSGVSSTDLLRIRPSGEIDASYLRHFLLSPEAVSNAASLATGANLPRLTASKLGSFKVPLPDIEEQRRIAAILDQSVVLRDLRREAIPLLQDQGHAIYDEMFESTVATTTVLDIALKTRTGPFGSQLLHSEFVDEGIAVLGLDNVVGNTFKWAQPRYIAVEKFDVLRRYQVESGDVLVSIMGTTGRCVVVPDGIPTAINTKHICAITVDRRLITPEFLRATFLWHPEARRYLRQQTKGSIMSGLNMGIVRAMPVPLPPLAQQQVFAQRLVAVEREVQRMEAEATELDALFASLQSRAFRGQL
ncbi:restriction endonuclease subunit S [Microbacterium phyllosphaerae]|uniref:restriction endonuclease subunit S n=1 Tax=Microbacterium phyllosphaerae TaxID=124798 RepID=UPI003D65F938